MFILTGLELLLIATLLYVLGTQVLLPVWRGSPLFPMLRTKQYELEHKLSEANQKVVEARLGKRIHERKAKATEIRKSARKPTKEGERQNGTS